MANQDATHIVTGMVRMSYLHIFTPYQKDGQTEPKYSMTVLLPKQDTGTMARIQAAIAAAKQKGVTSCWNGVQIEAQAPIYDGDSVRPKDRTPFSPECRGHWVINCSCKRKPEVVDANGNPILNETMVYSGCYGRVSLDFFPYASNGNKGIGCGLGNVQKLQDGESLGGGSTAEQDFGATGDAVAQSVAAPITPYQPPYTPQTPAIPNTAYPAQMPVYQPQAPVYPQQAAPQYSAAVNPITGLPM